MKKLVLLCCFVSFCACIAAGQKGRAEADYYPQGYSGNTWTGEVTAVDNELRTLTLTNGSGKKVEIFVATIPMAPYQWTRDGRDQRCVDFPFDKKTKVQKYRYLGTGLGVADIAPDGADHALRTVPNPPDSNLIGDLKEFLGRRVTVYFSESSRNVNGSKEKFNDVWRIRILAK